jgi:hypothetical protein
MKVDPALLLYGFLFLVASITLYRWNTSDKFKDFYLLDLIAEDGKLSARKFMEAGSWLVMTVAFVLLVERDKLTEWYVLAYGGLWIGARTAGQFIHAKRDKEASQ